MEQLPEASAPGETAQAGGADRPRTDFAAIGVTQQLPLPPIGQLFGMSASIIKPGESLVEMRTDSRFANPMGTLHGGVLCDLADYAMGIAYASSLGPGESFTTLELKINFFRPVWEAQLRALGKVVSRGRTVGMVECDIYDEKDRLIARVSSTCLTLRGEMASGR